MTEAGRFDLAAKIANDDYYRIGFVVLACVLQPSFHVEQILDRLLVEGMLATDAVRLIPEHVAPATVRMLLVVARGAVVGIHFFFGFLLSRQDCIA